ncbi:hypothetical protein [Streptomyces sp. NBC_01483]|uniref:hypothetical protein n=1 Tax=Streptomyces sp. NBC_01483 TaxID=2903883 RepID=UPI002E352CA9|nr:hypothetical protein [Streptomyces sp. NBC_01483]
MTDFAALTNTAVTLGTVVSRDELIATVRELRICGRWERATLPLDAAAAAESGR